MDLKFSVLRAASCCSLSLGLFRQKVELQPLARVPHRHLDGFMVSELGVAQATITFYPVLQIIVPACCRGKILVIAAVVAYYLKMVQASMPLSHCPCVVRLPRCLPEAVVPVLSMLLWKAHQQKSV